MTDPGRYQHPDLSPETEAESQEPDDDATIPQAGAPSNESLSTEGQILDHVREIRRLVEADTGDRETHRVTVARVGLGCMLIAALAYGSLVVLGLVLLVALSATG